MRFKIMVLFAIFSSYLFGGKISVAVSANVSYAIDELKREFNRLYPDIKVEVSLGSSGKLATQIRNHAPYQIFMSADMIYPETLYREGLAITRPIVYAKGGLVYLSTKTLDFSQGVEVLQDKNISKIAVANPKTAPYGKASFEALEKAGVLDDIKGKFVYGESVSQTVSYTITATDIGIVAKSSLYSPKMGEYREGVNWISVDPKLYNPIEQGIVILKNGEGSREVASFYAFILSVKAEKILKNFGYIF